MVCAILLLMSAQIISVADGVAGWANTTVLAITCLLAIADALASTGSIDYYVTKFIGRPKTLGGALIRMMIPGMFIACWISSTAVVAMMLPIIMRWSKKINQSPSKLLMLLCNAIHLGGTCTLIGTTTNLVIYAFAQTYYCRTWSIFFLTPVGLPVAICGMGVLLLMGPKLLPSKEEYERRVKYGINYNQADKAARRRAWMRSKWLRLVACFLGHSNEPEEGTVTEVKGVTPLPKNLSADQVVYALVPQGSPVVGQSIQDAGLRQLQDLFLVSVLRNDTRFTAVGREFVLEAGDVVSFAGHVKDFVKFAASKGLKPVEIESGINNATQSSIDADPVSQYTIEAVVRAGSNLIGKTPKDVRFRSTYNASIIGIYSTPAQSSGGKAVGRIGLTPFKVGDIVVAVAGPDFDWNSPETLRDLKPRFVAEHVNNKSASMADDTLSLTQSSSTDVNALEQGTSLHHNYLYSMRVATKAPQVAMTPLHGKTVDQAGIRHVPGVTLVAIERKSETFRVIEPDFVLEPNDILWYVGEKDGLASLRIVAGLEDATKDQIKRLKIPTQYRRLVEIVLAPNSEYIGRTVRESRFRTRFEAVIVAIQRPGVRLFTRIGDAVLEAGDVLICDTGPNFLKLYGDDTNFLIVSEIARSEPPRHDRFFFAVIVCTAMVILAAIYAQVTVPSTNPSAPVTQNTIDLVIFTAWALGLLLMFGVTTRARMYRAIDWSIVITIAAALALAVGLTNTGVAAVIGNAITKGVIAAGWGEIGVLAIIMILTEVIAALITAKAGAAVMFPIAYFAAGAAKINPDKVLIALMLGASDYTTPQGHQVNLIVQGPGAYRFIDYQVLGIPFEIFLNIFQILFIAYMDFPEITIPCSFLFLIACICIDHVVVEKQPFLSLTIFRPWTWWGILSGFLYLFYPFHEPPTVENAKRLAIYTFTGVWARDIFVFFNNLRKNRKDETEDDNTGGLQVKTS
jgi:di/tricarboxylate transporter